MPKSPPPPCSPPARCSAPLRSLFPASAIGRRRAGSFCGGVVPRAAQQGVVQHWDSFPPQPSSPTTNPHPLPSPPASAPPIQPPLQSEPPTSFRSNRSQASFPPPPRGYC
ncbi:hypothetical protein ZWY2020_045992 [Hordeum vulgare]|nr:hypothetical protein ZWY2020_045992 [Hordeum vulgare]